MRISTSRRWGALMAPLVMGTMTGCPGPNAASQLAEPPAFEAKGQAKCKVAASQSKPLIVEWPSADRTDLEARSRQGGLVVVGYEGCEMRLLSRCHAPGDYAYIPVTTKHDTIAIRNEDELYANIPMGAAKFESKLSSAGQLNVAMTLVGKFSADRIDVRLDELEGSCDGATHVVVGMSVGAFEFFAGVDNEVGGGLDVMGAGAGAKSKAGRETLTRDGDTEACGGATVDDEAPPSGCGASLRLEVVPLAEASEVAGTEPTDGTLPLDCPAGTDLVDGACQPKLNTDCPAGMQFARGRGCIPDVVQIPTVVHAHAGVPSRGPEDAPVLIQWFGGYQDPYTDRVAPTIAQLERAHPGKIRVEFRQVPLGFHDRARPAAYAALEAFAQRGELGFWKMHEALLKLDRKLDDEALEGAAKEVGLDLGRFRAALDDEVHKKKVDADFAKFNALGLRGTPSFLVGRDIVIGAQPFDNFDAAVKRVLAGEDGKAENLPRGLKARKAERKKHTLTVPPGAPTLGPPNAPVVIHWFGSYQEPFTARVAPAMKKLAQRFPRKVRIVWRHRILDQMHPQGRPAANLALLAHASGKFWRMHDILIANRGAVDDASLKKYGAQLGLDPAAVTKAIEQRPLDATINRDIAASGRAGATGVPVIYVNGVKVGGAVPFETLEAEVLAALQR